MEKGWCLALLPNNKSIVNINVKQIKWYTSTYHRSNVIPIQYKPKMMELLGLIETSDIELFKPYLKWLFAKY